MKQYKDKVVNMVSNGQKALKTVLTDSSYAIVAVSDLSAKNPTETTLLTVGTAGKNLSGYATVSRLNTLSASIDNLTAGKTQCTKLWSTDISVANIECTKSLKFKEKTISLISVTQADGTTRSCLGIL